MISTERLTFEGKLALVTGAGRGLGRAYAIELAKRGAHVIVHDAGLDRDGTRPDPSVAGALADQLQRDGLTAHAAVHDISRRRAAEQLIAQIQAEHGPVELIVHNAGIAIRDSIAEISPAAWTRMAGVNGEAAFWLLRAALPAMIERGFGRVVLTLTGHALYPRKAEPDDLVAYSAGKAMQFGILNSLAGAMVGYNVLINAISPVAATRMSTSAPTADLSPEHVVPGLIYLLSEACQDFGVILRAGGGSFSVGAYAATRGIRLAGRDLTPEAVAARWGELMAGPLLRP